MEEGGWKVLMEPLQTVVRARHGAALCYHGEETSAINCAAIYLRHFVVVVFLACTYTDYF